MAFFAVVFVVSEFAVLAFDDLFTFVVIGVEDETFGAAETEITGNFTGIALVVTFKAGSIKLELMFFTLNFLLAFEERLKIGMSFEATGTHGWSKLTSLTLGVTLHARVSFKELTIFTLDLFTFILLKNFSNWTFSTLIFLLIALSTVIITFVAFVFFFVPELI